MIDRRLWILAGRHVPKKRHHIESRARAVHAEYLQLTLAGRHVKKDYRHKSVHIKGFGIMTIDTSAWQRAMKSALDGIGKFEEALRKHRHNAGDAMLITQQRRRGLAPKRGRHHAVCAGNNGDS